jgi:hypothetical protein
MPFSRQQPGFPAAASAPMGAAARQEDAAADVAHLRSQAERDLQRALRSGR